MRNKKDERGRVKEKGWIDSRGKTESHRQNKEKQKGQMKEINSGRRDRVNPGNGEQNNNQKWKAVTHGRTDKESD